MQKPPISFRLSDQELEILEQAKDSGESLNQTAARLLREKLGIVTGRQVLEKTTLEEWLDKLIEIKIDRVKYSFQEMIKLEILKIDNRFSQLDKKLEGKSDRRLAKSKSDSPI